VPFATCALRQCGLLLVGAAVAWVVVVAPSPARADDRPPGLGITLAIKHLDNGLKVVIQEDHRVPLVAFAMIYEAGSRADPEGLSGVAALTSELMVRRTAHVEEGAYAKLLARAGAYWRYDTRLDESVFEIQVPSNQFALPLWLWSDQMGFFEPGLDEPGFEAQRELLEARRRASAEVEPLSHLDAIADEEMFPPGHPYRNAVPSSPEDVRRITRDDVLALHRAWFTPDHATLSIVGDVDSAQALAQVKRYFATLPVSSAGPRPTTAPSFQLPGQIQVDVVARVANARVLVRWPSPRYLSSDDATLDVLAKLLAGTHTGWLYWRLADEQKVAQHVWVHERSRALGSQLEVTIEGAPGRSPREILAAFDAALATLATRKPDGGALRMAVFETLGSELPNLDDIKWRAWRFARYTEMAGTPDYFKQDMQRYDVAAQSIEGAIAKWMPRDRRVVLLVQPDPNAPPGGQRVRRLVVPAGQP